VVQVGVQVPCRSQIIRVTGCCGRQGRLGWVVLCVEMAMPDGTYCITYLTYNGVIVKGRVRTHRDPNPLPNTAGQNRRRCQSVKNVVPMGKTRLAA
jgi:hypothetical protein